MNRLAAETSPYLLQHAENPVDWYPWGEEALRRAREEDKPIFLSIGYFACHWCHVMERECFAREDIAELLNTSFVPVKVDREERPDLDGLYMEAAVALNGGGGWPLNLFLTPEQKPFWAATYLPPEPRHGLRSFPDILGSVAAAWRSNRADLDRTADSLTAYLRRSAAEEPPVQAFDEGVIQDAIESLSSSFDSEWGGWGEAPKFPAPSVLEFLLRRSTPPPPVEQTLDAMAAGGMYDLVGGGFHRYSVDERWLIPHFEKMLVDNALLTSCYLHAWLVLGKRRYREVAEQTLDYMRRELALAAGGFASSQDADTDGVEGLTYTWARGEGAPEELLQPFEYGRYVLRGEIDEALRARLLELRNRRPQPPRDEKAIVSANGLTLASLAACGRYLERPELIDEARSLATFLLGPLSRPDGTLYRSARDGAASGNGYLEDYAAVAHGLLELHAASGERRWLAEAQRLALRAYALFSDRPGGGFFETPSDAEALLVRRKVYDDRPAPSGNALFAYVLARLARIYGADELEAAASDVVAQVAALLPRAPTAFGFMLVALEFLAAPRRELAFVGPPDSELGRALRRRFDPYAVLAFGPAEEVPLLRGKTLVRERPALYVCERFSCQAPLSEVAELEALPALGYVRPG